MRLQCGWGLQGREGCPQVPPPRRGRREPGTAHMPSKWCRCRGEHPHPPSRIPGSAGPRRVPAAPDWQPGERGWWPGGLGATKPLILLGARCDGGS